MLFDFREWKRERKIFPGDPGIKNLPVMKNLQETCILSLDLEDPLKKEMETHSSILAWEIPWTEEPSRLYPMGSQKS